MTATGGYCSSDAVKPVAANDEVSLLARIKELEADRDHWRSIADRRDDSTKRLASGTSAVKPIAVGDRIPSITIDHGFNPIGKVNMAERCKGNKSIIVGLPGAFTPC